MLRSTPPRDSAPARAPAEPGDVFAETRRRIEGLSLRSELAARIAELAEHRKARFLQRKTDRSVPKASSKDEQVFSSA